MVGSDGKMADVTTFSQEVVDEIAYMHWITHNTTKRITAQMMNTVSYLYESIGMPVLVADGEADAWCAMLYHLGVADFVVSGDTDFIAFHCDVFFGVFPDEKNGDDVSVLFYDDFVNRYKRSGYTEAHLDGACSISSADHNPIIWDKEYCFPKALSLMRKKKGSVQEAMKALCREYNRVYDERTAQHIASCYALPFDQSSRILEELRDKLTGIKPPRLKLNLIMMQLDGYTDTIVELIEFGERLGRLLNILAFSTAIYFFEYFYQIWFFVFKQKVSAPTLT
jgi:hypothetical protein